VLLALLVTACRAPAASAPLPPDDRPARASDAVPAWVGEPLSWDKLAAVEAWLAGEGRRSTAFWRIEAELELAQGRLEFAVRDREAGRAGEAALAPRLALARAGFAAVAADRAATPEQRRRAEQGGELAGDARAAPAPKSGLAVIARAQWGPAVPRPEQMTRASGRWTRITVHHSAEADAPDLDGSMGSSADALRRIQHHAMAGKDYGDIGYHFIVDPDGRVFEGRSLAWQGAHAKGDNNVDNIGVCVMGNFEQARPTPAALSALQRTLDHLRRTYRIPRSGVVAHLDLRNTLCPGRELVAWLRTYR
jgi:hypothetical protein